VGQNSAEKAVTGKTNDNTCGRADECEARGDPQHVREQYKLMKTPMEGDGWMVESKDKPLVVYGQVLFEKGKLSLVVRDWTNGDVDSFAFAQALHGALEQFGKEGRNVCNVSTGTTRTPVMEQRSITLHCRSKNLVISTTDMLSGEGKGRSTDIQELLASEGGR
jgi:hypothetical protein